MQRLRRTVSLDESRGDLGSVVAELESAGRPLSAKQQRVLTEYLSLVHAGARRMNLVSARDLTRLARRHLLESFNVLRPPLDLAGACLLDIGSGAGFPAIPLAVHVPDLRAVLVESIQKKARFLEETIARLASVARDDLQERVTVMCVRAEELSSDAGHAGRYDAVTARGVGEMARVASWASPLLRDGGYFVAFKGTDVEKELLRAMPVMSRHDLRLADVQSLRWGRGSIVLLQKHAVATTLDREPVPAHPQITE